MGSDRLQAELAGADQSGLQIQEEMSKFRDLEYCKIDLIAAKGIVFVKYAKSSSALLALESILANDCMVRASVLTEQSHICAASF